MNAQILHAPRTRSIRIEWITYACIAVFGSFFYGASLAATSDLAGSGSYAAIALAVSAGAGWIIFGLCCLVFLRPPLVPFIHACLVTMACGEAVLAVGALLNFAGLTNTVIFNSIWVAISNVTMLGILTSQFSKIGIRAPITIALWMVVLNGIGLLVFAFFYPDIFPR